MLSTKCPQANDAPPYSSRLEVTRSCRKYEKQDIDSAMNAKRGRPTNQKLEARQKQATTEPKEKIERIIEEKQAVVLLYRK